MVCPDGAQCGGACIVVGEASVLEAAEEAAVATATFGKDFAAATFSRAFDSALTADDDDDKDDDVGARIAGSVEAAM